MTETQVTLFSLPHAFREALALHHIIEHAFGIPTGDIYVNYYENRKLQVVAQQGKLQVAIFIGDVDMDGDTFIAAWQQVAKDFNAVSQEDRAMIIDGAKAFGSQRVIIAEMMARGFRYLSYTETIEQASNDKIRLNCPFCIDGKVGIDAAAGEATHTLPACETFTAHDPLEFIVRINDKLRKRIGERN